MVILVDGSALGLGTATSLPQGYLIYLSTTITAGEGTSSIKVEKERKEDSNYAKLSCASFHKRITIIKTIWLVGTILLLSQINHSCYWLIIFASLNRLKSKIYFIGLTIQYELLA